MPGRCAPGRKRIHDTPNAREIAACGPWFEAGLAAIRPEAVVGLGATAAKALIGRGFKLTAHHGQLVDSHLAPIVTATFLLSSILRAPDPAGRRAPYEELVADLGAAQGHLRRGEIPSIPALESVAGTGRKRLSLMVLSGVDERTVQLGL